MHMNRNFFWILEWNIMFSNNLTRRKIQWLKISKEAFKYKNHLLSMIK